MANELYDVTIEAGALGTASDVPALGRQFAARNHLGNDKAGAEGVSKTAEWQIGNSRHRCEYDPIGYAYFADRQRMHSAATSQMAVR